MGKARRERHTSRDTEEYEGGGEVEPYWVKSATDGTESSDRWLADWGQMRPRWYPEYFWRWNYGYNNAEPQVIYPDYVVTLDTDPNYTVLPSYGDQRTDSDRTSEFRERKRSRACCTCCVVLLGMLLLLLCLVPLVIHFLLPREELPTDVVGRVTSQLTLVNVRYTEDMANSTSQDFKLLADEFENEMFLLYGKGDIKPYYRGARVNRLTNGSVKVDYDLFFEALDLKVPTHRQLKDILYSVERDVVDNGLGVLGDLRFRIDTAKFLDTNVVTKRLPDNDTASWELISWRRVTGDVPRFGKNRTTTIQRLIVGTYGTLGGSGVHKDDSNAKTPTNQDISGKSYNATSDTLPLDLLTNPLLNLPGNTIERMSKSEVIATKGGKTTFVTNIFSDSNAEFDNSTYLRSDVTNNFEQPALQPVNITVSRKENQTTLGISGLVNVSLIFVNDLTDTIATQIDALNPTQGTAKTGPSNILKSTDGNVLHETIVKQGGTVFIKQNKQNISILESDGLRGMFGKGDKNEQIGTVIDDNVLNDGILKKLAEENGELAILAELSTNNETVSNDTNDIGYDPNWDEKSVDVMRNQTTKANKGFTKFQNSNDSSRATYNFSDTDRILNSEINNKQVVNHWHITYVLGDKTERNYSISDKKPVLNDAWISLLIDSLLERNRQGNYQDITPAPNFHNAKRINPNVKQGDIDILQFQRFITFLRQSGYSVLRNDGSDLKTLGDIGNADVLRQNEFISRTTPSTPDEKSTVPELVRATTFQETSTQSHDSTITRENEDRKITTSEGKTTSKDTYQNSEQLKNGTVLSKNNKYVIVLITDDSNKNSSVKEMPNTTKTAEPTPKHHQPVSSTMLPITSPGTISPTFTPLNQNSESKSRNKFVKDISLDELDIFNSANTLSDENSWNEIVSTKIDNIRLILNRLRGESRGKIISYVTEERWKNQRNIAKRKTIRYLYYILILSENDIDIREQSIQDNLIRLIKLYNIPLKHKRNITEKDILLMLDALISEGNENIERQNLKSFPTQITTKDPEVIQKNDLIVDEQFTKSRTESPSASTENTIYHNTKDLGSTAVPTTSRKEGESLYFQTSTVTSLQKESTQSTETTTLSTRPTTKPQSSVFNIFDNGLNLSDDSAWNESISKSLHKVQRILKLTPRVNASNILNYLKDTHRHDPRRVVIRYLYYILFLKDQKKEEKDEAVLGGFKKLLDFYNISPNISRFQSRSDVLLILDALLNEGNKFRSISDILSIPSDEIKPNGENQTVKVNRSTTVIKNTNTWPINMNTGYNIFDIGSNLMNDSSWDEFISNNLNGSLFLKERIPNSNFGNILSYMTNRTNKSRNDPRKIVIRYLYYIFLQFEKNAHDKSNKILNNGMNKLLQFYNFDLNNTKDFTEYDILRLLNELVNERNRDKTILDILRVTFEKEKTKETNILTQSTTEIIKTSTSFRRTTQKEIIKINGKENNINPTTLAYFEELNTKAPVRIETTLPNTPLTTTLSNIHFYLSNINGTNVLDDKSWDTFSSENLLKIERMLKTTPNASNIISYIKEPNKNQTNNPRRVIIRYLFYILFLNENDETGLRDPAIQNNLINLMKLYNSSSNTERRALRSDDILQMLDGLLNENKTISDVLNTSNLEKSTSQNIVKDTVTDTSTFPREFETETTTFSFDEFDLTTSPVNIKSNTDKTLSTDVLKKETNNPVSATMSSFSDIAHKTRNHGVTEITSAVQTDLLTNPYHSKVTTQDFNQIEDIRTLPTTIYQERTSFPFTKVAATTMFSETTSYKLPESTTQEPVATTKHQNNLPFISAKTSENTLNTDNTTSPTTKKLSAKSTILFTKMPVTTVSLKLNSKTTTNNQPPESTVQPSESTIQELDVTTKYQTDFPVDIETTTKHESNKDEMSSTESFIEKTTLPLPELTTTSKSSDTIFETTKQQPTAATISNIDVTAKLQTNFPVEIETMTKHESNKDGMRSTESIIEKTTLPLLELTTTPKSSDTIFETTKQKPNKATISNIDVTAKLLTNYSVEIETTTKHESDKDEMSSTVLLIEKTTLPLLEMTTTSKSSDTNFETTIQQPTESTNSNIDVTIKLQSDFPDTSQITLIHKPETDKVSQSTLEVFTEKSTMFKKVSTTSIPYTENLEATTTDHVNELTKTTTNHTNEITSLEVKATTEYYTSFQDQTDTTVRSTPTINIMTSSPDNLNNKTVRQLSTIATFPLSSHKNLLTTKVYEDTVTTSSDIDASTKYQTYLSSKQTTLSAETLSTNDQIETTTPMFPTVLSDKSSSMSSKHTTPETVPTTQDKELSSLHTLNTYATFSENEFETITSAAVESTTFKPGFKYLWSLKESELSSLLSTEASIKQPDDHWKVGDFSDVSNSFAVEDSSIPDKANFKTISDSELKPREFDLLSKDENLSTGIPIISSSGKVLLPSSAKPSVEILEQPKTTIPDKKSPLAIPQPKTEFNKSSLQNMSITHTAKSKIDEELIANITKSIGNAITDEIHWNKWVGDNNQSIIDILGFPENVSINQLKSNLKDITSSGNDYEKKMLLRYFLYIIVNDLPNGMFTVRNFKKPMQYLKNIKYILNNSGKNQPSLDDFFTSLKNDIISVQYKNNRVPQLNLTSLLTTDMNVSDKTFKNVITYLNDTNLGNDSFWNEIPKYLVSTRGLLHESPKLNLSQISTYIRGASTKKTIARKLIVRYLYYILFLSDSKQRQKLMKNGINVLSKVSNINPRFVRKMTETDLLLILEDLVDESRQNKTLEDLIYTKLSNTSLIEKDHKDVNTSAKEKKINVYDLNAVNDVINVENIYHDTISNDVKWRNWVENNKNKFKRLTGKKVVETDYDLDKFLESSIGFQASDKNKKLIRYLFYIFIVSSPKESPRFSFDVTNTLTDTTDNNLFMKNEFGKQGIDSFRNFLIEFVNSVKQMPSGKKFNITTHHFKTILNISSVGPEFTDTYNSLDLHSILHGEKLWKGNASDEMNAFMSLNNDTAIKVLKSILFNSNNTRYTSNQRNILRYLLILFSLKDDYSTHIHYDLEYMLTNFSEPNSYILQRYLHDILKNVTEVYKDTNSRYGFPSFKIFLFSTLGRLNSNSLFRTLFLDVFNITETELKAVEREIGSDSLFKFESIESLPIMSFYEIRDATDNIVLNASKWNVWLSENKEQIGQKLAFDGPLEEEFLFGKALNNINADKKRFVRYLFYIFVQDILQNRTTYSRKMTDAVVDASKENTNVNLEKHTFSDFLLSVLRNMQQRPYLAENVILRFNITSNDLSELLNKTSFIDSTRTNFQVHDISSDDILTRKFDDMVFHLSLKNNTKIKFLIETLLNKNDKRFNPVQKRFLKYLFILFYMKNDHRNSLIYDLENAVSGNTSEPNSEILQIYIQGLLNDSSEGSVNNYLGFGFPSFKLFLSNVLKRLNSNEHFRTLYLGFFNLTETEMKEIERGIKTDSIFGKDILPVSQLYEINDATKEIVSNTSKWNIWITENKRHINELRSNDTLYKIISEDMFGRRFHKYNADQIRFLRHLFYLFVRSNVSGGYVILADTDLNNETSVRKIGVYKDQNKPNFREFVLYIFRYIQQSPALVENINVLFNISSQEITTLLNEMLSSDESYSDPKNIDVLEELLTGNVWTSNVIGDANTILMLENNTEMRDFNLTLFDTHPLRYTPEQQRILRYLFILFLRGNEKHIQMNYDLESALSRNLSESNSIVLQNYIQNILWNSTEGLSKGYLRYGFPSFRLFVFKVSNMFKSNDLFRTLFIKVFNISDKDWQGIDNEFSVYDMFGEGFITLLEMNQTENQIISNSSEWDRWLFENSNRIELLAAVNPTSDNALEDQYFGRNFTYYSTDEQRFVRYLFYIFVMHNNLINRTELWQDQIVGLNESSFSQIVPLRMYLNVNNENEALTVLSEFYPFHAFLYRFVKFAFENKAYADHIQNTFNISLTDIINILRDSLVKQEKTSNSFVNEIDEILLEMIRQGRIKESEFHFIRNEMRLGNYTDGEWKLIIDQITKARNGNVTETHVMSKEMKLKNETDLKQRFGDFMSSNATFGTNVRSMSIVPGNLTESVVVVVVDNGTSISDLKNEKLRKEMFDRLIRERGGDKVGLSWTILGGSGLNNITQVLANFTKGTHLQGRNIGVLVEERTYENNTGNVSVTSEWKEVLLNKNVDDILKSNFLKNMEDGHVPFAGTVPSPGSDSTHLGREIQKHFDVHKVEIQYSQSSDAFIGEPVSLSWRLHNISGWDSIVLAKEQKGAEPTVISRISARSKTPSVELMSVRISNDSVLGEDSAEIYVDITTVHCDDHAIYVINVTDVIGQVVSMQNPVQIYEEPDPSVMVPDNLFSDDPFDDLQCVTEIGYPAGKLFMRLKYHDDKRFSLHMTPDDAVNVTETGNCSSLVTASFEPVLASNRSRDFLQVQCGVYNTPAIRNSSGVLLSEIQTVRVIPGNICDVTDKRYIQHPFVPCKYIDCVIRTVEECSPGQCFDGNAGTCMMS